MLAHPGAILGPTGASKGPKTALKPPKMTQNHQKWPKRFYKAQNGPWGHKTVLRDIIHDYMSCWHTLGPFRDPKGVPKTALKPIWGPKTPLKGPRRAKIGTNASHTVQLTSLGPKKPDSNPTPQRSVPLTWNQPADPL